MNTLGFMVSDTDQGWIIEALRTTSESRDENWEVALWRSYISKDGSLHSVGIGKSFQEMVMANISSFADIFIPWLRERAENSM